MSEAEENSELSTSTATLVTEEEEEKNFRVDRAKTGRAKCKKCKQLIEGGSLRLAKIGFNPFGTGKMNMWHHVPCLFEVFKRQRATTAKIENVEDIAGWHDITSKDQEEILSYLPESSKIHWESVKDNFNPNNSTLPVTKKSNSSTLTPTAVVETHKDNSFRQFRKKCAEVANESSYTKKAAILRHFFANGSDGNGFKGDLYLWCKLLLPGAVKRIYNLQSKQLVKLFSKLFKENQDAMLQDLEKGDVAETVTSFFVKNEKCKPAKTSILSLQDVDKFLDQLSKLTKEEDQMSHFSYICEKCTSNDLKMIIRLVKHDLRINAGPKHILDAIDVDAYEAFQTSRDLHRVVGQVLSRLSGTTTKNSVDISLSLLTPVLPMLAEACKSLEHAITKCPNGMYAEVKYDGERVQIHKSGKDFKFFSRSLKPVLPHKVNLFKEHIPKAFPSGVDLILDAEVLMMDTVSGTPLPFGTLGIHKKNEFKDASPCLFVFDCMYYNGKSLLDKALKERRKTLHANMNEIPNHIMFAEMKEINTIEELEEMLTGVLRKGLEGLVLKCVSSTYEPGKRHWLKLKKDYLFEGALADTADLVVLGAWYGTGNKGGIMSVFLMGCYDTDKDIWCTVTKVHGHDDKTLEKLQVDLDMIKISKDPNKVPKWLNCNKSMIPDFVARDPKKMPVWEISGAEFTQHNVHTANGISIRFPRVLCVREDKTWETATTLAELMMIYERSKEYTKFDLRKKRSASKGLKELPKKLLKLDIGKENDMKVVTSRPLKLPSKRLPDVFNGIKIVFPVEPESLDFYRYFVAYGGEVLEHKDAQQATHFIPEIVSDKKLDGKPVSINWIWDSIRRQKLQDDSLYTA